MSFIEYFYDIVGTCYNTRFKLFIEYFHSMFKYDITKDLCRLLNVSTIYWKCFTTITSFIEKFISYTWFTDNSFVSKVVYWNINY